MVTVTTMASSKEAPKTSRQTTIVVVVVGAGIAGLSAAVDLLKLSGARKDGHNNNEAPSLRVVLLEARNRIGGRIHTQPFNDDPAQGVDLGASFVHGVHDNPLTALSREVPFSLYLPPEGTTSRYLSAHAPGQPLKHEVADQLDFVTFSAVFSRLRTLVTEHPTLTFDQRTSMQDALLSTDPALASAIWPSSNGQDRGADHTADIITNAAKHMLPVWAGWTGAPLDQVALKWWGFEQEYEGEDAVVKEGYGPTLVRWHHEQILSLGGEVRLETEVTNIAWDEDDRRVQIKTVDVNTGQAQTLHADRVICTLPIGVLQHQLLDPSSSSDPPLFSPPWPARRLEALKRVGSGLLDKVVLRYSTAWWRDESLPEAQRNPLMLLLPRSVGIKPDGTLEVNVLSAPPSSSSSALTELSNGPLLVYDYDVVKAQPTLVAFIPPPLADQLELATDATIGETLHSRLVNSILRSHQERGALPTTPTPAPPLPLQVIPTRWRHDPYARGSYSFLSGSQTQKDDTPHSSQAGGSTSSEGSTPLDLAELARPLWDGRLGFAGEHCHVECYASVHGALLTGRREAARVWSEIRRLKT